MRREPDEDDADRELLTHLEIEAEERRDGGLTADAARDAARRALGNRALIKEDIRAVSPWSAVDDFAQDVRYGLRMLRRQPGFTIVAAVTLALGIGATTAIFSVIEAVLLRPLPYPHADRLVMVWEDVNLPAYKNARNTPAPGNFRDWRRRSSTFVDMAAIRYASWSLTGSGEPIRIDGEAVSASLFPLLQADPVVGRAFTADEERPGASRVALLGYGLWAERFGSSPAIVGQTIRLNDEPYTVVGVMPKAFHFPDADDQLWVPLALPPEQLANHDSHFLRVVARLRPGVTLAQAQADLDGIAKRLTAEYPQSNGGVGVSVITLPEQTVGDVRRPLLILLAVVCLLLLMVCANIGNLLLARASARAHEFAVRVALGAGRRRLVRQLLAETLLLAVGAGALGLLLAWWAVVALRGLAPANLPRADEIGLNATVGLVNFIIAIMVGFICGAVPELQTERLNLHSVLKDDARGSTAGARVHIRGLLVVVETALGVIILVGSGLLLRSFIRLEQVPLGFRADGVLTFRVILPPARYPAPPQRGRFYQRLEERLRAVPGVNSAGAISFLPLTLSGRTSGVSIEGEPPPAPGQVRFVDFRSVSPGYFTAMSIPILAGRDAAWSDTPTTQPVIVVSQTMAQRFWPNQRAIGKRLKLGRHEDSNVPWLTVAGIVGDVRQLDLVKQPRPAMYSPASQDHGTGDTLRDWVVRTAGDPTTLASAVRDAVRTLDPLVPITRVQTMGAVRSAATARERFNLRLVGLFACLALVLAAVGLYGVTAYAVAQRTRELGIRLALGAQRGALMRLVLGHGTRLMLTGLALGIAATFALARVMTTLLFGIGAHDPITFAGVGVLLSVVGLLACYIPARRAMHVDPVLALRH